MSPCCWPAATSNPTHTCSHLTRPACCRASEVFWGKIPPGKATNNNQPTLRFGQEKTPPPFAEVHAYTDFQAVLRSRDSSVNPGGWGVRGSRKWQMWQIWLVFFFAVEEESWWARVMRWEEPAVVFVVFFHGVHRGITKWRSSLEGIFKKNIALFGLVM